jgi:hypothetical protein
MGKMKLTLFAVAFTLLGFVMGGVAAIQLEKYFQQTRADELLKTGVALSDLDGEWPIKDTSGIYRAFRDRREASTYFLLASSEIDEGKRATTDLYLGLLNKGGDWCITRHYLQRAEAGGAELGTLTEILDEAKAKCQEK